MKKQETLYYIVTSKSLKSNGGLEATYFIHYCFANQFVKLN